jgi:hypothetical protein
MRREEVHVGPRQSSTDHICLMACRFWNEYRRVDSSQSLGHASSFPPVLRLLSLYLFHNMSSRPVSILNAKVCE